MKLNVPMSQEWRDCPHDWVERIDSMWHNEHRTDVKCCLCGCPGDKDNLTGEVVWPTT